jgi:hypothetical protein
LLKAYRNEEALALYERVISLDPHNGGCSPFRSVRNSSTGGTL